MSDYIIFRFILDYALILFGIWAIAAIVTNALFAEMKRRPRIGASKRQGKFYNIIKEGLKATEGDAK